MRARGLQYQNDGGRVVAIGTCTFNLESCLEFYRGLFGSRFPRYCLFVLDGYN